MAQKVQAVPEGFHTITPHFIFENSVAAIEFYKNAFGAKERMRMPGADGKSTMHAEITIGNSIMFLSDEAVSMGRKSAKSMGGSPVSMHLYIENVDDAFKRAVSAGCTVKMPPTDMFWGDRFGMVTDAFGYDWGLSQHTKDLTPAEMAKASEEAAKQFAQK
jgi:PhnB protein